MWAWAWQEYSIAFERGGDDAYRRRQKCPLLWADIFKRFARHVLRRREFAGVEVSLFLTQW